LGINDKSVNSISLDLLKRKEKGFYELKRAGLPFPK
jgi:hypothetical protein